MMERSFSEALKQRRTYYSITNQSEIVADCEGRIKEDCTG